MPGSVGKRSSHLREGRPEVKGGGGLMVNGRCRFAGETFSVTALESRINFQEILEIAGWGAGLRNTRIFPENHEVYDLLSDV
jgi:hypothetical protein